MRKIDGRVLSEPHKIVVRIFSEGKFYDIHWNPDTAAVLSNCVKHDGAYIVARDSERDICLKNRIT